MIKAVVFDLDNTLVDFMRVKRAAVDGAVDAMLDAGLRGSKEEVIKRVFNMYDREGIEDQRQFWECLILADFLYPTFPISCDFERHVSEHQLHSFGKPWVK